MTPAQALALNQKFSVDISRFVKNFRGKVDSVVRKVIWDMSAVVIMRTPVDTGRLKANWQFGTDVIPSGTVQGTDKTPVQQPGGPTEHAIKRQSRAVVAGHVHYLVNNLPYAAVIEYGMYPNPPKQGSKKRGEAAAAIHVQGGYSMQAPAGMVRITVLEYMQFVRNAANSLPP